MAKSSRFIQVRGENGEWMVLDMQGPHVICYCTGFKAPLNAQYVAQSLEHYHSSLYQKMGLEDVGSLDQDLP